jgi:hypothetical protein
MADEKKERLRKEEGLFMFSLDCYHCEKTIKNLNLSELIKEDLYECPLCRNMIDPRKYPEVRSWVEIYLALMELGDELGEERKKRDEGKKE